MADPLTSGSGGGGPFDAYLNPATPPQQYQSTAPKQISGWQGAGGSVAQIADKFLDGVSRGQSIALQRSQQENGQKLALVRQAMSDVQNANIPDSVKQQQLSDLQHTFGQMVYHQIGGGDKQSKDQPQTPGDAIKHGVKNFLGSLIGEGRQKENIKPEDLQKTLSTVYTTLRDPNMSLTAHTGQADQQLYQAADAVKQKLGGTQPTTAQLMQDPNFFKAYSQAMGLTGKPTPGMQAILGTADAQQQQQYGMEKVNATQGAENARAALQRQSEMDRTKLTAQEATARERDAQKAQTQREQMKEQAEGPLRAAQIAKDRAQAYEASEKARATKQEGGGTGGGALPNDIAEAIISGDQPPDLRGLYKDKAKVMQALARKGYNLATAERDWQAINKHVATLNGAQQERLRQAISFTSDSIPQIENLYKEWQATGLPSGFKTWNKAALVATTHLPGKTGAVAQNLLTQINDLTSEMGTVYKGGNSSTDESLKLAASNLSGDWNADTFNRAIGQLKINLKIRQNSINSSMPMGVSANSPYMRGLEGGMDGAAQSQGAPPQQRGPGAPPAQGQGAQRGAAAPQTTGGAQPKFAQTATNPKTGQKMGFDGKQWVAIP